LPDHGELPAHSRPGGIGTGSARTTTPHRIAPPSSGGDSSSFYPQAKHKLNGNCKEGRSQGASRKEGVDEPGGHEADQDGVQSFQPRRSFGRGRRHRIEGGPGPDGRPRGNDPRVGAQEGSRLVHIARPAEGQRDQRAGQEEAPGNRPLHEGGAGIRREARDRENQDTSLEEAEGRGTLTRACMRSTGHVPVLCSAEVFRTQ